jgi:hypothetical protein
MAKKDVSAVVSGMGVAMSVITALVAKVRELGGSDEDIHRLATPEGENLLSGMAEVIIPGPTNTLARTGFWTALQKVLRESGWTDEDLNRLATPEGEKLIGGMVELLTPTAHMPDGQPDRSAPARLRAWGTLDKVVRAEWWKSYVLNHLGEESGDELVANIAKLLTDGHTVEGRIRVWSTLDQAVRKSEAEHSLADLGRWGKPTLDQLGELIIGLCHKANEDLKARREFQQRYGGHHGEPSVSLTVLNYDTFLTEKLVDGIYHWESFSEVPYCRSDRFPDAPRSASQERSKWQDKWRKKFEAKVVRFDETVSTSQAVARLVQQGLYPANGHEFGAFFDIGRNERAVALGSYIIEKGELLYPGHRVGNSFGNHPEPTSPINGWKAGWGFAAVRPKDSK